MAYTKPQQRRKTEESERLRGERDQIYQLPTVASFKTKIIKHGWVKNAITRFANSLSIKLCSMYIIFLDIIANYLVNSWYQLVFFFKLYNTNFK